MKRCLFLDNCLWLIHSNEQRDLGCNSVPIEFAVFLLTCDFHADICTEQIGFDPLCEIAELENVFETIIPTPSFLDKQLRPGELKQVLRVAQLQEHKTLFFHPSLTISNLSAIQKILLQFFFFSVSKDVEGGNKKIVHTVKSPQEGSDRASCRQGNAERRQLEQALLCGSRHLWQKADNQRGLSYGSMVSSDYLESQAVFADGNKEWCSFTKNGATT